MQGGGRVPAVVLATRPLGEADLLVVLCTPQTGKIRCAARNARKSRRRFPGGLPGGSLGEADLVPPKRGTLWRLDRFTPGLDMSWVGRDLDRFAYVAYVCELTDVLVQEPEADPRLFAALSRALARIVSEPPDPGVLRAYELQLLDALGYLPSLDCCCVCGRGVQDATRLDFHLESGFACPEHDRGGASVAREVVELCEALRTDADDARTRLAAAPAELRREVRDLGTAWVRRHLTRPLRALEFFAKVGGGGPRPSSRPPVPATRTSDDEGS